MRQSIIDGAPDTASGLAQEAVAAGVAPLDAINYGYVRACMMWASNSRRGEMFLPDMMASSEAMRAAMGVLEPELKRLGAERPMAGVVVLGTTKGDIHEIGKTLVGTLLTAHGFRVHDLGVDVPGREVCRQSPRGRAPISSACRRSLTTTMRNQKGVIEALEKAGLRSQVKVMVGGAPVTRRAGRKRLALTAMPKTR